MMANRITILILFAVLMTLAGCPDKTAKITTTSTQEAAATQPAESDCQAVDEMDFLDCMVKKTKCTVADAARAACMLATGGDVGKTYTDRYQYMLERGMVRKEWKLQPDQWIDRGTLAHMFLKAAGMKGGVNMLLFGSWGLGDRRYAYREMRYYELMDDGVDYCCVSGPELVTALGKVDRFCQDRGKYSANEETNLGQSTQPAGQ
jgi:hypothetical protein